MARAVGIIPARYGSTRLPGKPLIDLAGKPMIQWVVENAKNASSLHEVVVATDDKRIFQKVKEIGCKVFMTPSELPSGTDRIAFVAKEIDAEVIVNIQGDEPFIHSEDIDRVVHLLEEDPLPSVGTLVKRIQREEEWENPNTAKVVVDENGYALYFSRGPIPFFRDGKGKKAFSEYILYKHVGIYSYRKDFLLQFAQWPPTTLEQIEKLEQLRVLQKGYRIKTAETPFDPICVDTPEDVDRVREWIKMNRKVGICGLFR